MPGAAKSKTYIRKGTKGAAELYAMVHVNVFMDKYENTILRKYQLENESTGIWFYISILMQNVLKVHGHIGNVCYRL